ncbi:hypothetical protein F3J23_13985 [Chryseobacterium sp. Tr-659]|uniref:polysaccharide lyase family 8 super-sandwich domain-containing protein n=1 Tax=Chryseobacterium sp. Tr-659 TaxID=2608340 RepID=UPI00142285C5|nr:polysaccharide lyase family 8 super-sandwich domain-containing protein [Chryseobacterium sp. Tr-659]NIF06554.1 hypothetical protein [Chryseobacterium sp. Tr-659]
MKFLLKINICFLFLIPICISSQIGIHTENPNGVLDVNNLPGSNKYGVVLPNTNDSTTIQNPTNQAIVSGTVFFNSEMDQAQFRNHKNKWVSMNGITDNLSNGAYLYINKHFVEVPKGTFYVQLPQFQKEVSSGNYIFISNAEITLPNGSIMDIPSGAKLLTTEYIALNPALLSNKSIFHGDIWSFYNSSSRIKVTSLARIKFLGNNNIELISNRSVTSPSKIKIDLSNINSIKYYFESSSSYFTLNKKFTLNLTKNDLLIDIDDDLNEKTKSFYKLRNNNIEFQSAGIYNDIVQNKKSIFATTSNFNYSNNYGGRIFKIDSLARLHFLSENISLKNTASLQQEILFNNTIFTPSIEIEAKSVYNICKISGESNGTIFPNNVLESNKIFLIGYSPALISDIENLQSATDPNDVSSGGVEGVSDINTSDIDGLAQSVYSSLNKAANRTFLWPDLANASNPQHMRDSFLRIEYILKSVVVPNSIYYNDSTVVDILNNALDWLYNNRYNHLTNAYVGNWWFWEIGVGVRIANIVTLGKGLLNSNLLNKLVDESIYYSPDDDTIRLHDPLVAGQPQNQVAKDANKSNLTYISTIRNAFKNNTANFTNNYLSYKSQMILSTGLNDGPLETGDFMHFGFAYNGGYGRVFWQDAVRLYVLFKSAGILIDTDVENFLLNIFKKNFSPFTYKGNGLQAFIGRGVSRKSEDFYAGKEIYNQGLLLAKCIDKPGFSNEIQKIAKHQINNFGLDLWKKRAYNAYISSLIDELQNNNNIISEYPFLGPSVYPISDRAVFRDSKNTSTISVYSKRTKNYESINGENFLGHYEGYGLMLNHPDHTNTFHDFYWPTAEYKKLPGTTTTDMPLETSISPTNFVVGKNAGLNGINDFSNSIKLDNFSFTSNHLIGLQNNDISAYKSWMMTDGVIVHTVSNIISNNNYSTKTVIDYRKTTTGGGSKVSFNNNSSTKLIKNIAPSDYTSNISSIFIDGVEDTSRGTGYIFPSFLGTNTSGNNSVDGAFNIKFTQNSGKYQNINSTGDTLSVRRSYYYIERYHGVNPTGTNSNFQYIILPSTTKADLLNFTTNNPVNILQNNNQHLVSYKINNNETLYGLANFNQANPSNLLLNSYEDFKEIIVSKASIFLMRIDKNSKKIKLAFADPDFNQNQIYIKLKGVLMNNLTGDISNVISNNFTNGYTELLLDVSSSLGKTYLIEFNYQ